MPHVFVAQALVDRWLNDGVIQLDGELMRLAVGANSMSLFISPAVYFEQVDGGGQDQYQVVGSVKSSQELAQMGGEHFDTSVVLGEQAYTVVPGFIALPVGPDGTETLMNGATWGQLQQTLMQISGA